MNGLETLRFAFVALRAHRGRSILSALGIAIGIVAVTLLTAIGEGLHQMLLSEFTQFGTRLVVVTPGHTTTTGRPGAIVNNVRPLTVADAEALRKAADAEACTFWFVQAQFFRDPKCPGTPPLQEMLLQCRR